MKFKITVWELGKVLFEHLILAECYTRTISEGKTTLLFWETEKQRDSTFPQTPLYAIGVTGTYRLEKIDDQEKA